MKRRPLLWTAVGVLLFGAGTGLMIRLRGPGEGGGGAFEDGESIPAEVVVHPRPAAPGEVPAAPAEAAGIRVVVTDTSGAPLPGAAVRLRGERRAVRSPFPDPVLASGTTGADGSAELRGAPLLAGYRAEASLPGRADGAAAGPGPAITVVLARGARLSGRVLEEGTGAPVPGARVEVEEGTAAAVADGGGAWSLDGLPPGAVALTVRDPLHGPPARPVAATLVEGASVVVDLVVPRGVPLAGRVLFAGADGRPVAGGLLSLRGWAGFLSPPRWEREARLDGEGRFRLASVPVDDGTECLVTTAEGLVLGAPFGGAKAGMGEVTLLVDGNRSAADQVHGRVIDARGAPVAGARVLLGASLAGALPWLDGRGREAAKTGPGIAETVTGADGRYVLPGTVPTGPEVLVLHPDHAPRYVRLPDDRPRGVHDFVLGDPVCLLVRLVDGAGVPAAGAEVRAFLRRPDREDWDSSFGDVLDGMRSAPVTDGTGQALLGPLGNGSWYVVAVAADGRSAARLAVEVDEGVPAGVVEATLAPLREVSGRLLDLDGRPMEGVEVRSSDGLTMRDRAATTDGDGRFSLGWMAQNGWPEDFAGCWLNLRLPGGGLRHLEAVPGTPVTWVVARPGEIARTILVEVLAADGRPARGGTWEIRFPGGRGGIAEGWGGRFHSSMPLLPPIPLLPGRNATLEVRSPGQGSATLPLDSLDPSTPLLLR